MSTFRRVCLAVVASSLAVAGLDLSASAQDAPAASAAELAAASRPARATQPEGADIARGLIVRTTTPTPSDAVLDATDDALGSQAEVTGDTALSAQVSTVGFDQVVDGDVADAVAAQVEARPDVVWAMPDRLRRVQTSPPVSSNDPFFSQQHNLWDASSSRRGGYSIKSPDLWRATKGAPSTVVAVIDTGITAHPDLAGKVVQGYDFISNAKAARDGSGRDADPTDAGDWNVNGECSYPGSTASSWHGTFVAGQIAATANNRMGITGVAPGVVIQPVRALGSCGGYDSDILDSITWASGGRVAGAPANTAAPVVNLSLAGLASTKAERDAACRAYDGAARAGRARGSIFIAAAGNEGANANLAVPASCSEYISVGATSRKGFSAVYSNIGSTVDLTAPGGDTLVEGRSDSIVSLGNYGAKTAASPGYLRYEGTSMAAPQVAGAAALLRGLGFRSPAALKAALLASVSPFRARSKSYASKKVRIDGQTYRADLNCTTRGRHWCGRGMLDLSRVQAPVSAPSIRGAVVIGEPLTATGGSWVSKPASIAYTWRSNGTVVGRGATYHPTRADVGRSLTVQMSPASGPFASASATSAATSAVPAGPQVALTLSRGTVRWGTGFTARVTASGPGFVDGPVQIRSSDGAVVGAGRTVGGVAQISIGGRASRPGARDLRAAYVGNGSGSPAASSPRRRSTVTKLPAKISTSLARSVRSRSRARLTVRVLERPDLLAAPTGVLRVYDGSRRIATVRLGSDDAGRRTIRLPRLSKGKHRIRVQLASSGYVATTWSARRTIRSR